MPKTIRLLAALLVLPALLGSDCQGQRENERVRDNRPPQERQVHPERGPVRIAFARVTYATGPYTVNVKVADPGYAGKAVYGPDLRPGGEGTPGGPKPFVAEVSYDSGARLLVTIEISGHASDTFACEIEDGHDNFDKDRGQGLIVCVLLTNR